MPEEVEKIIDRKSSMNMVGNLDQYLKYQTAESIRDAANNPVNDPLELDLDSVQAWQWGE